MRSYGVTQFRFHSERHAIFHSISYTSMEGVEDECREAMREIYSSFKIFVGIRN